MFMHRNLFSKYASMHASLQSHLFLELQILHAIMHIINIFEIFCTFLNIIIWETI